MRGIAIVGLVGLVLSACSTGMDEQDCATADWQAVGFSDGQNGRGLDRFAERTEQCTGFGVPVDQDAYFVGRDRGLLIYCTPLGGLAAGQSGETYQGVCAPADEVDFLLSYEVGRDLVRARQRLREAESELDSAFSSIRYKQRYIRDQERKIREATSEDRIREFERRIRRTVREIRRIEDSLFFLREDIFTAERQLRDERLRQARYEARLREEALRLDPPKPQDDEASDSTVPEQVEGRPAQPDPAEALVAPADVFPPLLEPATDG